MHPRFCYDCSVKRSSTQVCYSQVNKSRLRRTLTYAVYADSSSSLPPAPNAHTSLTSTLTTLFIHLRILPILNFLYRFIPTIDKVVCLGCVLQLYAKTKSSIKTRPNKLKIRILTLKT